SGCAAALDAEHYLAALEDTATPAEAAAEAALIDETDSGAIPDPRATVGAQAVSPSLAAMFAGGSHE
ncbi:hypothetical protein AB4030_20150, partial [Terrabacter sp. 2YAF2]